MKIEILEGSENSFRISLPS